MVKQINFVRTQVRLSADLHSMIVDFAKRHQLSMNEAFIQCCRRGITHDTQHPSLLPTVMATAENGLLIEATTEKETSTVYLNIPITYTVRPNASKVERDCALVEALRLTGVISD
ncbi:MAG: hypothetical protein HKM02_07750 [Pseudomonadales bacterium]|nr:hypothetical protein [Pseudomonadales bacterium]